MSCFSDLLYYSNEMFDAITASKIAQHTHKSKKRWCHCSKRCSSWNLVLSYEMYNKHNPGPIRSLIVGRWKFFNKKKCDKPKYIIRNFPANWGITECYWEILNHWLGYRLVAPWYNAVIYRLKISLIKYLSRSGQLVLY